MSIRSCLLRHLVVAAALAWFAVIAVMTEVVAAKESAGATRVPGYVTTAACASCHEAERDAWIGSHHDWALRPATPESALGDFDDTEFTHFGITSRFYRRDRGYFVETEGPDDLPSEFKVRYAVGVTPLQQYLVALEGGRLQALGLAWDVASKRWFHLYPDEAIAPGSTRHLDRFDHPQPRQRRPGTGQVFCGKPGRDPSERSGRTTAARGNRALGFMRCDCAGADHGSL